MIQRFERVALPSNRTAPVTAIERITPAAGSTLALPFGEIAGDFRASGRIDKQRRRATYELLIANNTPAPVATFAYALEGVTQPRITWDAIIVPAHSAVSVDIDVAMPRSGNRPRMIAEIYAHESKLVLDARGDVRGTARRTARRAIAGFAGLAALLTGTIAYASMRPSVVALAAPQTVKSGATFDVAYAARASAAEYSVQSPDGTEVASGVLDPHADSFAVALPRADVSSGYDVRVSAHGVFGSDERTVHVTALAPVVAPIAVVKPHLAPVQVSHLSLASDTVEGGQPIVVSYWASVPGGNVRLIDQYGTVRGEALLSGRGRSTLVAPYVDADQDLRVVVSAQRGNARAASAIPVTIKHVDPQAPDRLPASGVAVPAVAAGAAIPAAGSQAQIATQAQSAASEAAPAPSNPEDAAVGAPAKLAAAPSHTKAAASFDDSQVAEPVVALPGPPISVNAKQVAGEPVRVHILRHDAGLHLAMMGPGGDELVSENVAPGTTTVLLQAPTELSKNGRGYSIVATFSRGVAQETLIRSIAFK